MSYDFFVFPSGSWVDPASALAAYRREIDGAPGEAPAAVSAFVAELLASPAWTDEDEGWLSVQPDLTSGGSIVSTTYADIGRNLRVLTRLGAAHDLSVLDVQNGFLFDPTDQVSLDVDSGLGIALDYLSPSVLDLLFEELGKDPWIVVDRGDEHYVQVYRNSPADFQVEHREGSADKHWQTTIASADEAKAVIWDWAVGGSAWRTRPDWHRLRL